MKEIWGWHGRGSDSDLAREKRPYTRTAHLVAITGEVAIAPSTVPPGHLRDLRVMIADKDSAFAIHA